MKVKPTYEELENQIAELKEQNDLLKISDFSDKISNAKYRSLIDNTGDVIVIMDSKGNNHYNSPNIEKNFGWKPEDLVGKSTLKYIYKEDLEIGQRFIRTVLNEPNVLKTTELRFKCKGGSYKWIEFSCCNLLNDPDIKGLLANFKNINEHKQNKEKIKQQNSDLEFLKSMTINSVDLSEKHDFSKILLQDLKSHTGAVLAVFSFYDSSKKKLILQHIESEPSLLRMASRIAGGKILKTASPVDDRKYQMIIKNIVGVSQSFTEITFGAIPRIADKAIRASTGIDRLYAIAHVIEGELFGTSLIAFKKGQATPSVEQLEFYAYLMSVSVRRSIAERALQESEKRFRVITESSPDAICLTDKKGKITYANRAAADLLDYTNKELVGKTILDITPRYRAGKIMKLFAQFLTSGKLHIEVELVKKDGSTIPCDFNAVMLPNGIAYGSCRDITQQKRSEAELIAAKENAEKSDHLKSVFLANMSHEIRTPMNGILGFADLLKQPTLSGKEQRKYINIIEESGERMLNIINDIVNISKIESGLMEVVIQETNISDQVKFIYTFFKPEMEDKGILFSIGDSLPSIETKLKTDREKVFAILTNLVKNAVKYTEKGSIEIGYTKKDNALEFYVKDTGIGIGKDRQGAIFERFIQADVNDKMARQGAGLGLSISRAYAEMLGGKIWVKSEEGVGSTFYFTLPYDTEMKIINKPQSEIFPSIEMNMTLNLKILIVEDDESSELLISIAVQNIAKEIICVKSGIEAVAACRKNPDIDLVLMDIRLPIMDGYEATRRIREFNNKVIVIAQTAYALEGDREEAIAAGCNGYISKPIKADELMHMIIEFSKRQ